MFLARLLSFFLLLLWNVYCLFLLCYCLWSQCTYINCIQVAISGSNPFGLPITSSSTSSLSIYCMHILCLSFLEVIKIDWLIDWLTDQFVASTSSSSASPLRGRGLFHEATPEYSVLGFLPGGVQSKIVWRQVGFHCSGPCGPRSAGWSFPLLWRSVYDGVQSTGMVHTRLCAGNMSKVLQSSLLILVAIGPSPDRWKTSALVTCAIYTIRMILLIMTKYNTEMMYMGL